MKYPDEVITQSKKGKKEARVLVDSGRFVRYKYVDVETGEEDKKIKIVLAHDSGYEEYFIIPMKDGRRYLLIPTEKKPNRKIWNEKVVDLFEILSFVY